MYYAPHSGQATASSFQLAGRRKFSVERGGPQTDTEQFLMYFQSTLLTSQAGRGVKIPSSFLRVIYRGGGGRELWLTKHKMCAAFATKNIRSANPLHSRMQVLASLMAEKISCGPFRHL